MQRRGYADYGIADMERLESLMTLQRDTVKKCEQLMRSSFKDLECLRDDEDGFNELHLHSNPERVCSGSLLREERPETA